MIFAIQQPIGSQTLNLTISMAKSNSPQRWKSSRDYLRHLINVAFMSISIPLPLFAWLYLEYSAGDLDPLLAGNRIIMIEIGFSVLIAALLVYAHSTVNTAIAGARARHTLPDKLTGLRNALVRRYIFFAFITLLVVIGFVLTTSEVMVAWFAVMILLYSIQNPSVHAIVRQLRLKDREKEMILKHEPFYTERE